MIEAIQQTTKQRQPQRTMANIRAATNRASFPSTPVSSVIFSVSEVVSVSSVAYSSSVSYPRHELLQTLLV